jgi:hypothetical protein
LARHPREIDDTRRWSAQFPTMEFIGVEDMCQCKELIGTNNVTNKNQEEPT